MDNHKSVKEVVNINTLYGFMDNIHYNLLYFKYPDYTMKIMCTSGLLLIPKCQKRLKRV